jgi:hypothetical protein
VNVLPELVSISKQSTKVTAVTSLAAIPLLVAVRDFYWYVATTTYHSIFPFRQRLSMDLPCEPFHYSDSYHSTARQLFLPVAFSAIR